MFVYLASLVLLWIGATAQNQCGPNPPERSGTLKSPGYPVGFPQKSECTWKIIQPKGNWINFTIEDLNIINPHGGCDDGYLNIIGLTLVCGTNKPTIPLATNHEATIKFISTGANGRGFSLRYDTISCNKTIKDGNGEIVSPNYPNPYPHGVECSWTIETSYTKRVKVEFIDMDINDADNCSDSLQLIDLYQGGQFLSGVYCGKMIPSPAYSKSYKFMMKFTSNGYATGRGFKLRYSTVQITDLPPVSPYPDRCNLTLNAASGIIKPPNYPRTLSNRYCIWQIQRPKGDWIHFEILDLDLNNGDLLTLADDTEEIFRYTDKEKQWKSLITKNNAVIKFNITTASSKRGFMIRYMARSCNREIFGGSGEIYSPNYPIGYPKNMECTWKIKAPLGKKVYVDFLEMDTVQSTGCKTLDAVKLFNVVGGSEILYGVFCGSMKPSPTVSTGNELWITFQSKTKSPKRGFAFKYDTAWSGSIVVNPSGPLRPIINTFGRF